MRKLNVVRTFKKLVLDEELVDGGRGGAGERRNAATCGWKSGGRGKLDKFRLHCQERSPDNPTTGSR